MRLVKRDACFTFRLITIKIRIMEHKEKNTIKKTAYLSNKAIADFYYHQDDTEAKKTIKSFVKHYKKLIDFFNVRPPKISVFFVYTRKEMDKKCGWKTEKWICGAVNPKSIYNICIFSPLVFEKLTTHKKDEIIPTIIHETAHAFVSRINKRCFVWINEGVCEFVEGTNYDNRIKRSDWRWFRKNNILVNPKMSWQKTADHGGYKISYNLVKYIFEKYGKKSIISLLKIKRNSQDRNLKDKIVRILGEDLDKFLKDFEGEIKLV